MFIHDLKLLKVSDPALYESFRKGYFAARKTDTEFSKIAYDHIHEQNNKITKSRAGFSSLLNKEDTAFLRKMENVLPEIHSHLSQIEGDQTHQTLKHKESMPTFITKDLKDCRYVYKKISTNPFRMSRPMKINTNLAMPPNVVKDMSRVFSLGVELYKEYKDTRFVFGTEDVVNSTIKKNQLKLPHHASALRVENPVTSISPATIIKLRGACSHRGTLATELFRTDFSGAPECFIKNGKAFHSTKSQILQCVVPVGKPVNAVDNLPEEQSEKQTGEQPVDPPDEQQDEQPENYMTYIVDLSVEVRARASSVVVQGCTFREFIMLILNSIASNAREYDAKQIDLVIDFYNKLSIMSGTRSERGIASRVLFELDDNLPRNLPELLRNDLFKTDLYSAFSDPQLLKGWTWKGDYCITSAKHVSERMSGNITTDRILCFPAGMISLEEADNRIVLHIRDSVIMRRRETIMVRTVDSDVVVILVGFFMQFLQCSKDIKLSVDFGVSDSRIVINIKVCFNHVGKEKALALPFFHALSGCDSTASFFKKSKISLYTSWMKSPSCDEITNAFKRLSWLPTEKDIEMSLPVIFKFIGSVYGYKTDATDLDLFRLQLFKTSSNNNFRELPPSKEGLELHIRRCSYQSGWVWGNSTSQEQVPPVRDFGWTVQEDSLSIQWVKSSGHSMLEKITKICSCKPVNENSTRSKKCKSCICGTAGLACLEQCKCHRSC